ncbi:recombinase family protein [Nocardia sp. KC 131]|uniref:recombinase family protein n=1 Tax=Nocardia arseniciresistens TaxID=3392119 RepID=UPI00398EBE1C
MIWITSTLWDFWTAAEARRRPGRAIAACRTGPVAFRMSEPFRVGYCRSSTDAQDVEIQTDQLLSLGVPRERIFIDTGFSGTTRKNRAGLCVVFRAITTGTPCTHAVAPGNPLNSWRRLRSGSTGPRWDCRQW